MWGWDKVPNTPMGDRKVSQNNEGTHLIKYNVISISTVLLSLT